MPSYIKRAGISRGAAINLRSAYSVNTDYVKVPIIPDFVDNFPNFSTEIPTKGAGFFT